MIKYFSFLFSIGAILFISMIGIFSIYIFIIAKDLPNYEILEKYEPPVITRIHASDGELIGEFATRRRLYLPIQSIPNVVRSAYISAEDKNFYKHYGLDFEGFSRAIIKNIKNIKSGRRPEGASTITQQVAKNFLLNSDPSIKRKIKEAILSLRIENAFSKDHILELYLNEIYLGHGAYGIASAALTYFGKSVDELTLEESAYLAVLPKGPGNYDPLLHKEKAISRRNWVIDRMIINKFISKSNGEKAKKKPLKIIFHNNKKVFVTEYFTEEVRKNIITNYGAKKLYEGGLYVRTTLDLKLQNIARKSLYNGLIKFDQNNGWRGPYKHINLNNNKWQKKLENIPTLFDIPEWELAIVLEKNNKGFKIGLQKNKYLKVNNNNFGFISIKDMKWAFKIINKNGKKIKTNFSSKILRVGDIIFVQSKNKYNKLYFLRQVPKVQGAIVAMDPITGRVLAMIGGFSYAQSQFNRATQAYRQPGSAFKPFVYAAALDNGYTPASVVLDGPLEIDQGPRGLWKPKNYFQTFSGPSTLRYGIENSRNLMTVRLANDLGMSIVAEYAERFGLYDKMQPVLSMSLGAGETTVLRMVSAYSVIANGGRSIVPSLIDRIQDRYGRTIYKYDQRSCEKCNIQKWDNNPEPIIHDEKDQVLDPMTAYQITSMMEGSIKRGTATQLRYLNRSIAGKTGTTNDSKDAWFIGFTPNIVVGVFMGYDIPESLGLYSTGSALAVPIFAQFMEQYMKDKPNIEFKMPVGMRKIVINRRTGMKSEENNKDVIIEAFKPGTGPADIYQVIGFTNSFKEGVKVPLVSPQVNNAIEKGYKGLY